MSRIQTFLHWGRNNDETQPWNLSCRVVQPVTSLNADLGVSSLIPAQSHTFVEIDHEILFTAIILLPLIQEGLLLVTSESVHEVLTG